MRLISNAMGRRTASTAATFALVTALATGATLTGVPAGAAAMPTVNVPAAAAQCDISYGVAKQSDPTRAAALMAGQVDLEIYGTFHLATNPTWRPVSTLDSSGNGHMHSLFYLLPLLREGVRTGNASMVNRFYAVLKDWVHDNPTTAATRRYAWGSPIYEGFRSLVLVCAAAGPRGREPWLVNTLAVHGTTLSDPRRYEGVNNASLHQSMGLYAIGAAVGRNSWKGIALRREMALATRLVHTDGSDEEGAVLYGINDYRWFREAAERLRRGGDAVPAEFARVDAMPAFIARATRPDGRVEALGDTSPQQLSRTGWVGTAAEFAASKGASGAAPADTFAAFAGGYAFGRSGWGTVRPLADETWWSVRAGQTRHVPHAHDDAAALTLYAHGSPLLLDTGQWRYQYGATRQFVASRAAHNVVLVTGVRRTPAGHPAWSAATVGGIDLVTVVDRGYAGVTLTRTIAYDRTEDVLLVWDRLASTKRVTASQQWGLGRDRAVALAADAVHTSGPGANVSMLFTSGGAPLDVAKGAKSPLRGWNSQAYGELSPSPSVRATQSGTALSWLTVIAPRAADVAPAAFSATASVTGSAASVALTTPAGAAVVTLTGANASRSPIDPLTPMVPLVPSVTPSVSLLLAGRQTTMRVTGLPPSQPVSLQARPLGATEFASTGAEATASAAGTAAFTVPVLATSDYRAVSGAVVSAVRRVTAAVPPAPPAIVGALPGPRGTVTLTFVPSPDTGGAPLTRFDVTVGGARRTLAPTARSVTVPGVVPGARVVTVRAANAVAVSPVVAAPVAVPTYPSIAGRTTVRKGTKVTLAMRGLRPGEASLVLTPAKGKPTSRALHPGAAGTARVTLTVKATLTAVVTSSGAASAPRRITAR